MKYVTRTGSGILVKRPPATGSVAARRAWNACFDELLEVIAEQAAVIRELRQSATARAVPDDGTREIGEPDHRRIGEPARPRGTGRSRARAPQSA